MVQAGIDALKLYGAGLSSVRFICGTQVQCVCPINRKCMNAPTRMQGGKKCLWCQTKHEIQNSCIKCLKWVTCSSSLCSMGSMGFRSAKILWLAERLLASRKRAQNANYPCQFLCWSMHVVHAAGTLPQNTNMPSPHIDNFDEHLSRCWLSLT